MTQLQSDLTKAKNIVEKIRYQFGVSEFIQQFIDEWAFYQTGLYKPKTSLTGEMKNVAIELSIHLSMMMKKYCGQDVIGMFFSECNFNVKHLSFFPTPPEVSKLVNVLLYGEKPELKESKSLYEPCSGTGSIAMNWILNRIKEQGSDSLKDCEIVLEDISEIMCKASVLQIINMCSYLKITPKKIVIQAIDTLTRKKKSVLYILEREAVQL